MTFTVKFSNHKCLNILYTLNLTHDMLLNTEHMDRKEKLKRKEIVVL